MKSKIILYVLHGTWNTKEMDGVRVFGIAEDIEGLKKQLEDIKSSKAKEYLNNPHGTPEEESGERYYEITNFEGEYAKFYITEHYVEISSGLIKELSRVQTEKNQMSYSWKGMQKLTWEEVQELHKQDELVGCYRLYPDNTEGLIDPDYTWEEMVEHHESGGEFGYKK